MDNTAFYNQTSFCQNKRIVINRHTGSRVLIDCGVCPACLNKKYSSQHIRLLAGKNTFKYSIFVTLTYEQKYTPSFRIDILDELDDSFLVRCYDSSPSFRYTHEHSFVPFDSFKTVIDKKEYYSYIKQADLGNRTRFYDHRFSNTYSYINYKDLSDFCKRFRRLLFYRLKRHEKVYTYFVSEYSPKHLRSHFHLLFCFDADEVSENFGKCIVAAWRFGRIDWSQDRGQSSSYIASYVNSLTRLPRLLRENKQFKPRSRFSSGFVRRAFVEAGQSYLCGTSTALLDGISVKNGDKLLRLLPRDTDTDSFVFVPAKFNHCSSLEVFRLISGVKNITERPAFRSCSSLFEKSIKLSQYIITASCSSLKYLLEKDHALLYVMHYLGIRSDNFFYSVSNLGVRRKRIQQAFYRLFLQVKSFLFDFFEEKTKFVYEERLLSKINLSIRYWNEKSFNSFRKNLAFFRSIPENLQKYFFGFSYEQQREFRSLTAASLLRESALSALNLRVKHREINDANKIYCN